MSTIAIVGGHGNIARLLTPLLVSAGHDVVGLIRNPDHGSDLEDLGARWKILDIEASDVATFAQVLEGADVVVFAAGGGPDGKAERKRTVDLEGSLKSIAAARDLGISRFVQISAIGVDEVPDDSVGEVWVEYVKAKRDADVALRASGLDWTIIRPGGLTDDQPTGKVELGQHVARESVPRADVAAVLAAVIDDDSTIGHQFELISGEHSIPDAITAATSAA